MLNHTVMQFQPEKKPNIERNAEAIEYNSRKRDSEKRDTTKKNKVKRSCGVCVCQVSSHV